LGGKGAADGDILIDGGGGLDAAESGGWRGSNGGSGGGHGACKRGLIGEGRGLAHSWWCVGWTEEGDEGCVEGGIALAVTFCGIEHEMECGTRGGFGAALDLRDVTFDESAESEDAAGAGPRGDYSCLYFGSNLGAGDVEWQGEVGEKRLGWWGGRRLRGDGEA